MTKSKKHTPKTKQEIIEEMVSPLNSTPKPTEEEPKPKIVRFTENGRIEWENFINLYEVIGFMQLHIFQQWAHPIFQNVFLRDVVNPPNNNQEVPEEDQIAREAIEEIVEKEVENGELEKGMEDDAILKKQELEYQLAKIQEELKTL